MLIQIYQTISDGGDGSASVMNFATAEERDAWRDREEEEFGYIMDDNGGSIITINTETGEILGLDTLQRDDE